MNRKEVEIFMAEKGLGYTAWKGYEAPQIYTVAGDASLEGASLVLARVSLTETETTYHWGFYHMPEALHVARSIKRLRKVSVDSVTIIHAAERI